MLHRLYQTNHQFNARPTAVSPKRVCSEKGFTLILSLFLLSILASVGVAFALLVVLESKGTNHKRHVIRARENARTAVYQAVQTIQQAAGADQRVSARAEISVDPDPMSPLLLQTSRKEYWTPILPARDYRQVV